MTEWSVACPHVAISSLSHIQVVSLPSVTEAKTVTAIVSAQVIPSSMQYCIEAIALSALFDQDQCQVQSLLQKYGSMFSANGGLLIMRWWKLI